MPVLCSVLLIFSFQFSLLFFNISLALSHQHCSVLLVLIRNIRHRTLPKFGYVPFFLYGAYRPGENSELILMVKMETRHPIEGSFGSEFHAICNHCGVMVAWSRKSWKFCEQFLCLFLVKRPLMVKLSKFCSKRLHGDTDWRCCVQTL